ncbi:hypothetical protein ASPWEDRAFT_170965 [Aspergillus wentii DTO 134E9]|uniref:Uncharacterized protein n=1 Tax=Aspergillus wentii DTO 134E9 TaxID=1073089 RepID=A0A1L9RRJ8_ASPWE|nr:uncharacterized protein ASPWEDRAFT_170965 [Aspergillus wentii DTO 134E9]KAI9930339.1 hypothetical protein MW887_011091 [Aspergillus wentii]OJJ37493.1 hypothetical protein ASPWEDRAFT_170965 [Aspergillus wentii DTO 134E9]
MSDRKRVIIRFDWDKFNDVNEKVINIIREDTGTDQFIVQPSYPPVYHPPPLSEDAIEKLKALDGVQLTFPDDEE